MALAFLRRDTLKRSTARGFLLVSFWLLAASALVGRQGPVTLAFRAEGPEELAFARELWADVQAPDGQTLRLPAYYSGKHLFEVRARPVWAGSYRLTAVFERAGEQWKSVSIQRIHDQAVIDQATRLPSVGRSTKNPASFELSDGREFWPIGANLAWTTERNVERFYRRALSGFAQEGLNWTRIWMSHWGRLNLDWLHPHSGRSPAFGRLDLDVAKRWDRVLELAEEHGVYVQLVLQHHGQVSSRVNSNWAEHPWNAANGGFLNTPEEFFTSEKARQLTKLKYRYAVARWGWSPAIFAWELFNEVHWTDAMRTPEGRATVAAWHAEMAAYIRSLDAYGHLITTSTHDLRDATYEAMDFYQPHLYAPNMIAAVQRYPVSAANLARPVFYGEVGDDHQPLSDAQKRSGIAIVPTVWASLMGEGIHVAQPWLGADLLASRRVGELGAAVRFRNELLKHAAGGALDPFYPRVVGGPQTNLTIVPGQNWQRHPPVVVTIPTDGRHNPECADIPRFIVGSDEGRADGFPDRTTFRIEIPNTTHARLVIADAGPKGSNVRVWLDGHVIAEEIWPAQPSGSGPVHAKRPREISFELNTGAHEILLENNGGDDWFEFGSLDLGLQTSLMAAVGKRSSSVIAGWVWREDGVFSLKPPPASDEATIIVDDVPAGTWQLTWWDSVRGEPRETESISHAGGDLHLKTSSFSRHAAFILRR